MKIGVVSDIHCNVLALDAALKEMGEVDELFCAGDSVYGYRWSNEVFDLLRMRGAHIVMGNHDYDFLQVHKDRNGSNGHITPENYRLVAALPGRIDMELAGRRILMVHASPFEPYGEYIYPHTPKYNQLSTLDADVFIYGHTHTAVAEQLGPVLVVNPGSVGEVRDRARPYFTYAVVDLRSLEAKVRNVHTNLNGATEPGLPQPSAT